MKTEAATIQIDASPQTACAVVAGPGCCRGWNPLFAEASGQVAARKTLTRAEADFGVPPGPSTGLRSR